MLFHSQEGVLHSFFESLPSELWRHGHEVYPGLWVNFNSTGLVSGLHFTPREFYSLSILPPPPAAREGIECMCLAENPSVWHHVSSVSVGESGGSCRERGMGSAVRDRVKFTNVGMVRVGLEMKLWNCDAGMAVK